MKEPFYRRTRPLFFFTIVLGLSCIGLLGWIAFHYCIKMGSQAFAAYFIFPEILLFIASIILIQYTHRKMERNRFLEAYGTNLGNLRQIAVNEAVATDDQLKKKVIALGIVYGEKGYDPDVISGIEGARDKIDDLVRNFLISDNENLSTWWKRHRWDQELSYIDGVPSFRSRGRAVIFLYLSMFSMVFYIYLIFLVALPRLGVEKLEFDFDKSLFVWELVCFSASAVFLYVYYRITKSWVDRRVAPLVAYTFDDDPYGYFSRLDNLESRIIKWSWYYEIAIFLLVMLSLIIVLYSLLVNEHGWVNFAITLENDDSIAAYLALITSAALFFEKVLLKSSVRSDLLWVRNRKDDLERTVFALSHLSLQSQPGSGIAKGHVFHPALTCISSQMKKDDAGKLVLEAYLDINRNFAQKTSDDSAGRKGG